MRRVGVVGAHLGIALAMAAALTHTTTSTRAAPVVDELNPVKPVRKFTDKRKADAAKRRKR